jgi:hypothetical protein
VDMRRHEEGEQDTMLKQRQEQDISLPLLKLF